MNEFDLIKKYLARVGFRVMDTTFYRTNIHTEAPNDWDIGQIVGVPINHSFFFGNVSIDHTINGVINLANQNVFRFEFTTLFYGGVEREDCRLSMGVNLGMSLMGNGWYMGFKRLYAINFNHLSLSTWGIGAATFSIEINLNGFLFTVI